MQYISGKYKTAKSMEKSWVSWLTPVILATQEAEIRKIIV
jgi:hypothetical protein